MTEGKLIEIVSDKLPDGVQDFDNIENRMVLSWTGDMPENMKEVNEYIIGDIYKEECINKQGIPEFDDLLESVDILNSECMAEIALIQVVQEYNEQGIDIGDVSEEKLSEDTAEKEAGVLDFYSYNGMIDTKQEIFNYAEEKGMSFMISNHTEEYDNFTWGIEMSEESQLDIIVNGPQIPMFPELAVDECENDFCRYGGFFLHVSEAV